ncbi:MAG TPA: cyclopropane-fatty-acyl-phospholipid synthase family protein [Gaiellales bacterium]
MSTTAQFEGQARSWVPDPAIAPARARIARALFLRAARTLPAGSLSVVLPGGRTAVTGRPGAPTMTVHREEFFHRLGAHGRIGFGEAYMAGDWSADDVAGTLAAFAASLGRLAPAPFRRIGRLLDRRLPTDEENTPEGAARNIARHYDLSNELFALFLDETMTYSCAIFEPGDTLATAQRRKYEALAELADVAPRHHVLDIGTGWGGMAIHLATTRGCRVTSATISQAQASLARERIAAAGVADLVEVVLRDYRQIEGAYDRIVSVEMFEAVGERYWPAFFACCDRYLRPGGAMGMQTITMPHRRYRATRRTYGWVHKYIFPGGLIPSEQAIDDALRRGSGLRVEATSEIGHFYTTTLRMWRERFLARADDVAALGFDATFRRMWEFYLAYCEAGFATGALGDVQLRLARP